MSISLINMLFKNLSAEHFWFSEGLALLRGLTQVFSKNFLSLDFLEGKDEFWTFSPSIEKYSIPKRAPPSPLLRISYLSILSPVPPSGRRWVYGILMQFCGYIWRFPQRIASRFWRWALIGYLPLHNSHRKWPSWESAHLLWLTGGPNWPLRCFPMHGTNFFEKVLIFHRPRGAPTDLLEV